MGGEKYDEAPKVESNEIKADPGLVKAVAEQLPVLVDFKPEEKRLITEAAKEAGMTVSDFIVKAMMEFIEQKGKEAARTEAA